MAMYTARSMTHSLQSVMASTEAARGALYSSASSPKPLRRADLAVNAHRTMHDTTFEYDNTGASCPEPGYIKCLDPQL